MSPTGGPGAPTIQRGQNALNTFLRAMSQDVPRELKRAQRMRAQLRKGKR